MNREQLDSMTIYQLRNLDIKEKADEVLVQEVLNEKLANEPHLDPNRAFLSPTETDNLTPEKEKELQDVLDEKNSPTLEGDYMNEEAKFVIEETPEETIEVGKMVKDTLHKPFCDKCTSKGVRHKKGCPNKKF